jgi:response regulator RpfG family c-di-GMP phosphodiesterase
MPTWIIWTTIAMLAWTGVMAGLLLSVKSLRRSQESPKAPEEDSSALELVSHAGEPNGPGHSSEDEAATPAEENPEVHRLTGLPLHILVVDDDPSLRALLRTSFEVADIEVEEADSAESAAAKIAARHPDVMVLDVGMPRMDGITFCRGLKSDPFTRDIPIVLLTGDASTESSGRQAGADAFLRKPFSPLALLTIAERLGASPREQAPNGNVAAASDHQLLLYAQDFRRLLELERGQRQLLQNAYRETVVALARALETKNSGTGAHSERVRRYANELTKAVDSSMLEQPGLEYGFILHDVGKIGIPDKVLMKPGPLTEAERRLIESHTVLGEQMVGEAALLRGEGARVVRSHHERWDGSGYPDRLSNDDIPIGARIFSIADALDAMTSDRPYRPAGSWDDAAAEIVRRAGTQFDPELVDVFREREQALRLIYGEFSTN